MKRITKRTIVLLGVVAAAVAVSVGAYAYWTTSGTGTGSADTGTDVGVTVNETSASTGLYPGGSVALSGNFTNAAAFNQYVTSVSASVDAFNVAADPSKPACTEADFNITGNPSAVGQQIAANSTGGTWSGLSLNMTNTGANQDNCKNITVPLSFSSN